MGRDRKEGAKADRNLDVSATCFILDRNGVSASSQEPPDFRLHRENLPPGHNRAAIREAGKPSCPQRGRLMRTGRPGASKLSRSSLCQRGRPARSRSAIMRSFDLVPGIASVGSKSPSSTSAGSNSQNPSLIASSTDFCTSLSFVLECPPEQGMSVSRATVGQSERSRSPSKNRLRESETRSKWTAIDFFNRLLRQALQQVFCLSGGMSSIFLKNVRWAVFAK